MRLLYLNYPICQSLSGKLSFTHYCELFSISDKSARAFYEQEGINSNWSVRELKRQIDTSLFERLLLSEGNTNKEKVLSLAKEEWDFDKNIKKYRFETFCYGPKACKFYKMGRPRSVPYKNRGAAIDDGCLDELCTEGRDEDD